MSYSTIIGLFHVAAYIRLSREDGDKEESDSVGNQRKLLLEYIRQKEDLKLYDIIVLALALPTRVQGLAS